MGTAALAPSLFDELTRRARLTPPRPAAGQGPAAVSGPTLEDLIVATWREIEAGSVGTCPVCQGKLKPVWSAGARPVGARCHDCGSRLS